MAVGAMDSLDEKLEDGIEFTDEEFIPEDFVTDKEKRRIIMQMIETELTEVQRQAVILYYYSGLTVSQIAAQTNCPEGTVKYRLSAARERIREAVLIYEKEHDDRLHAIAPIPVLTRILRAEAEQISVPDIPLDLPKANTAPANTILKKAGGSTMKNALTVKIIAGVAALGVVGGGIAPAVSNSGGKDNSGTDKPAVTASAGTDESAAENVGSANAAPSESTDTSENTAAPEVTAGGI